MNTTLHESSEHILVNHPADEIEYNKQNTVTSLAEMISPADKSNIITSPAEIISPADKNESFAQ